MLERWLVSQAKRGMAARTRNTYLGSAAAFAEWCVESRRLTINPLASVPRGDEKTDRRRIRRAMTEVELSKLLDVARRRTLLDALTVRTGKNKGKLVADVRDEVRDRLDALGRERALTYKTLVLTGLRRGELASLTLGQLRLDGPTPYVELDAADEKNREGAWLPLRTDLADDLRQWLADRLQSLQSDARGLDEPIPVRLPADMPLFDVPTGLARILDRDLKAAGIPKRDDRGRTIDVHALRTTFGTLLSAGGVALRTAQAAMRHSDPSLTANVYTDPRLLDVAGALDALPALRLDRGPDVEQVTGSVGQSSDFVAQTVATNLCNGGQRGTSRVNMSIQAIDSKCQGIVDGSDATGGLRASVSFADKVLSRAGDGIRTHDVQLGKLAFYH